MSQDISQNDLQALKLLDYVAGRFEIDAGFPMPGISAGQIPPSLASEFDAGVVDERRLASLAEQGFLSRIADLPVFSLTERALKAVHSA